MKRVAIGLAGVFVAVLAIVIGKQMSADAMAVVVGVVCGIGASIPTTLLMLLLVSRRDEAQEQTKPFSHMPSVMIVNPPGGVVSPYYQPPANQYLPPLTTTGPRQFQVLGSDDYDDGQVRYMS